MRKSHSPRLTHKRTLKKKTETSSDWITCRRAHVSLWVWASSKWSVLVLTWPVLTNISNPIACVCWVWVKASGLSSNRICVPCVQHKHGLICSYSLRSPLTVRHTSPSSPSLHHPPVKPTHNRLVTLSSPLCYSCFPLLLRGNGTVHLLLLKIQHNLNKLKLNTRHRGWQTHGLDLKHIYLVL